MKKITVIIVVLVIMMQGCSILKTVTNISRLKFKLDSVSGFNLNGISISNKSKLSDFTATDLLKLTTVFGTGKLPVNFNVNVAAKNPNDGTGGYPATDITLKSFDWDLYLNGKKTISGGIASTLVIPGVGESSIIPLKVELDLLEFFGGGGLNEVINLALKLGGKECSTSEIELIASPVLGTPIGDIAYPEPIKIVDYRFN